MKGLLLKDYFANTKRKSMPEHIWKISATGLKKHGTYGSVKNAVRIFINEGWYQCMTKP